MTSAQSAISRGFGYGGEIIIAQMLFENRLDGRTALFETVNPLFDNRRISRRFHTVMGMG